MATKRENNSIKGLIIAACVFIVIAALCFVSYKQGAKERAAIEGGVTVEAEIIYVERSDSSSDDTPTWYTVYAYIDENGVTYSGYGDSYSSEYEARTKIGTTIRIYVDGEGNSIAVGHEPGDKVSMVIAVIFSVLAVILLVLAVIRIIKRKDKTSSANDSSSLLKTKETKEIKESKEAKESKENKDVYVGRFDD